MKSATKFTLFGLGIFGLALVIALSIIFVFPLAVWMFKPGFDVMAQGIGLNPFLAKAITLTFALSCAYFLVRFVLTWRGGSRLIGFVGIFGAAIAFNILMYFLFKDKCVRVNEWGEVETYSGPCLSEKKVKEDGGSQTALGCDTKGELQERFHSHLTRFGEFESDFLLSRENLDRVPWFNQKGKPCIFYCANPGDVVSLYIRPGICRTGEKRKAVDTGIQELIYRKAREHERPLANQADSEEGEKESVKDKLKKEEAEKRQQEQAERVKAKRMEVREKLEKVRANLATARAKVSSLGDE